MTRVIIDTDSAEDTALALQFAEERGFKARAEEHRVLTDDDMIFGIGRPATDAELTEYLLKIEEDENDESKWISIEDVKRQFSSK
ncbi:hypothetical protein [Mucilaginibacter myungsuensis]|uniref:Uncharacterized protein n=1 Tax=Mucilaginibacter myungsuensis TaxID=649104 RepID=A0A929PXS4_9SPHI|nr:hypothetical protein [Mucilaginibacter myungsuensis]MBE9663471.1 hypothetical protein [Mucilaginibacter myungsuensis]MDN3600209.1 hypothetical protein [Mucilaginibacter myungsuensis]